MPRIDPQALQKARSSKNWTQAKLADECKIDQSTIWRMENGKCQSVRATVLEKLSRKLGLPPTVLTGNADYPDQEPGDLLDRCQLNLRVNASARNQLALVALEYGVSQREIVELAPFLFDYVAQKSLSQRRARHAKMLAAIEAASDMHKDFRHLPSELVSFWQSEEILHEERDSIERNDLFGNTAKFDNDLWGPANDYDESSESPFVRFLCELTQEMKGAEFSSWMGGPDYEICRAMALQLMGGDEEAANAVMLGNALLHEIPAELRVKGQEIGRARWARERAEEARLRAVQMFSELEALGGTFTNPEAQK